MFQKDSGTKSTCFGNCAVNWPPLHVSGKPTEGNGANPSLVGTTSRPGGELQVTYNGHPLYLFEGDKNSGDTNGEGVDAFGGAGTRSRRQATRSPRPPTEAAAATAATRPNT